MEVIVNMANNTERVCIHCGEIVKDNVEICPYCGLSVEANPSNVDTNMSNDNKTDNEEKNNIKKENKKDLNNNKDKKKFDSRFLIITSITILLLASVIVLLWFRPKKIENAVDSKIKGTVTTKEELNKKFDVDLKDPEEANDVNYIVESDTIAKLSYKKVVSDGREMNFVLRVSSSTEDIENSIGLTNSKGEDIEFVYTSIMMTVICDDESEIQVESKVALDDDNQEMKYMRALWYDNDKYYSMVTDNLVTREDFLKEVNRVIIANHETF